MRYPHSLAAKRRLGNYLLQNALSVIHFECGPLVLYHACYSDPARLYVADNVRPRLLEYFKDCYGNILVDDRDIGSNRRRTIDAALFREFLCLLFDSCAKPQVIQTPGLNSKDIFCTVLIVLPTRSAFATCGKACQKSSAQRATGPALFFGSVS